MKNDGLFDTNICIDELIGVLQARAAIDAWHDPAISIISWIEVMAGTTEADESIVRAYLNSFTLIQVSPAIAERAATLRRTSRLKLPDAIILATAQIERRTLVTRNTRDFDPQAAGISIPYAL